MSEAFVALDRDRIWSAGPPWRVDVFRETASTNDLAMRAGAGGEPEGYVVFAESQTRGRGQFGRRWDSRLGLGLWFSILLRPRWPAAQLPEITPLVAVAVARALAAQAGLDLRIKPPNDVFSRGRKLAGILSEARTGRGGFVAVGIGINVHHASRDFPLELRASATSLALESSRDLDRNLVAGAVLGEIAALYHPASSPGADILSAYAALSRGTVCDTVRP